ncbi:NAD(P)(+)--arginine ADP-ribosyltransferase 2-like [Ctenopharyngodon idella]|uniref:NAD(P)(+)--arginine ADP-ribosyltransferase 2-like n=1 Tax=Ctenopharyngodon idella TaxID=7959 RepID=UPI00223209BC|nr:NAD(P)(+)--arginine ADP-ribosyltransferase 2-like [Ctenopharyngodon idella]XP_051719222.1 NAD(P)(+)--arginine ADP-ribosyltransferase 2-like [Ctenopharyngodon idella]
MEQNSADDQYDGCTKEMAKKVETKYLNNEINTSPNFKTAWKKGKEFVKTPDILSENHKIAIYVYSDASIYKDFNSDTRSGKEQYKDGTYKWYSLYFLLTDAIQILKKTQNKCYSTCHGTDVKFDENVLNTEVRFGSFASSSICRDKTTFFGNKSCFEIDTCLGAEVTEYSKLPYEKEVLIPPYEKFKVTKVRTKQYQKDLWCDTVLTLESFGMKSDLNCAVAQKDTANLYSY